MQKIHLSAAGLLLAVAFTCPAQVTFTAYPLPTGLSVPNGITTGPDGNLWFAERLGNAIGRITTAGVITHFPVPTSDSFPNGISAGTDGNLWFTERNAEKIGRITTAGVITEFSFSASGKLYWITSGPDGNLWFTEETGDRIGRITPAGVITQFSLPAGSDPVEITSGPDGNLWFAEEVPSTNIVRMTTAGVTTEFPTASGYTYGITAGPDGNVWFAERFRNMIGRITPAGAITEFSVPTPGSEPIAITAGPDGNLWFAELNANQIGRITPAGVITEFFISTGSTLPYGITAGPDGNLWLTEADAIVKATIPSAPPGAFTIRPAAGGNAGTVTVQIFGSGFQGGTTVKLTGLGPDIVGSNTTVPNAFVLNTSFDLTGATPGVRDVVVTNPDGTSATLTGGFTVEQGGAPQISVDIIGRKQIRIGHEQTFFVIFGNPGNVDLHDVLLTIVVPSTLRYRLDCPQPRPEQIGLVWTDPTDWCSIPLGVDNAGATSLRAWLLTLPAGQSFAIPVYLTLPAPVGHAFAVLHAEIAPAPASAFSLSGNIADVRSSAIFNALVQAANSADQTAAKATLQPHMAAESQNDSAADDASRLEDDLKKTINFCNTPVIGNACTPFQWAGQLLGPLGKALGKLADSYITVGLRALEVTLPAIDAEKKRFTDAQAIDVESLDPNDKIGSTGFGAPRFVSGGAQPVNYALYFDNQPTATAPAQAVTVTDALNTSLDLTTLTLGPVTFPNQVVTPPSIPLSVAPFTTTVDLRPTTNLLVRVNASVNTTTGALRWAFQSLDPATGLPPTDPLAGFLPPGAEGSVFFTVMPKSTVTTGTVIQNTATVVFDANPPINTPTWSNTIDNTKPVSHVSALSVASSCPHFRVGWSGSDVGSGLRGFTIYASDNGGPSTPWLSNTTAAAGTYMGAAGHAYSFYSIATDLTGNIEPGKLSAEATTTVTGAGSCGPPSLSGQVTSISPSGTTRTVTLQITNTGFTAAQAVNINQITARTLSGSGAVVLTSPVLPAAEGPLAIGASTTVTLTLNVPSTVTRFSLTEGGTLQDGAGHTYSYSMAQTVIP